MQTEEKHIFDRAAEKCGYKDIFDFLTKLNQIQKREKNTKGQDDAKKTM